MPSRQTAYRMLANFLASAITATALPRRCAILAHHSCSARVLSVFHRSSHQAASTSSALALLFPALLILPRCGFSPELYSRAPAPGRSGRASRLDPRDPKTKDYIVMTSDFVITVRKGFGSKEQIRAVKYEEDGGKKRVEEKLEIERVYWEVVRGLDWDIVTEKDVDATLAANVEWVHGHREAERLIPLIPEDAARVEATLTPRVMQGGFRLRDLTNECDSVLGFDPGTSLGVVRHLIANRRWKVDMSKRIMSPLPLVLTAEPALYADVVRHRTGN